MRDKTNNQVLAYIDGELAGTVSAGNVAFHDAELSNPLYFGTDLRKGYFLNGEISEVRMWSDARTAEQIADYANQTVTGSEEGLAHAWLFSEPEDLGPNTTFNDLVTSDGIAVKTEGFAQRTQAPDPDPDPDPVPVERSGLRFDAKDKEYVQVQGTLDIPTTVETWIKLDPGTNARQIIMNNYVGSGNSWGIEVTTSNTLRYWEQVSGSSANVYFDDINVCTGQWMLISVVRDAANKQILAYINGELAGTQSAASLAETSAQLTKWLCFGSDYHSSPIYMNGEINEVRMWSDIRTADEIKQYYSEAVTGNENGLAHLWNFAEAGDVYSDTVFADQVTGGPDVKAVGFPVDPNTEYTVTFQLAGGTVSEEIANQTVKVGGTVTAPTQNPSKTGFTFTGWYKDSSCTTKWNFDTDTIQSDTTLYAGYQFTFVSANFGDLTGVSFSSATDQLCSAGRLTDIPRTFEATIKLPTDLTGRAGVICGNYMNAGYYDYDLGYVNFEIYENGQPRLYWQQGRRGQDPEAQSVVVSGVDLRQDEWVHVAFTFDENTDTVKCYINGTLVSTVDDFVFNPVIPAQALKVGGDYRGTGSKTLDGTYNSQYFKGEIANISIWSSVRTDEEIAADVQALQGGTLSTDGDGLLSAWSFADSTASYFEDLSQNDNDVADFVDWLAPDFAEGDYSMVALPDTQFLSERYPDSYTALTQWIVNNQEKYNIQAVMHMGDMVNVGTTAQWTAAKTAMDILDTAGIPWMPMRGNHDPSDGFNSTFPYEAYGSSRAWFGGSYEHDVLGQDKLDSTYWYVTVGEREYLILSLGWAPSMGALDWAEEIVQNNQDKNVIVTVHAFMYWDGTHLNDEDLDYASAYVSSAMDGSVIWDRLSKYPNVVLGMGGHIGYPDVIARTDLNGAGKEVTSLLCDAQGIDYTYNLAMMMLLTFHEDSDEVDVNWYSVCNGKLFRDRNQFTITVPHVGEESEPAETYTITFDANGGTVSQTSAVTGEDGKVSALPTPSRNGSYTFDGWYTSVSGGDKVTADTIFDADTTIYAHWTYTGGSNSGSSSTSTSSSGASSCTVSVNQTANGTVTIGPKSASKGDTVTITVKPDNGYELCTLIVTNKNGDKVEVIEKNGEYTFIMPASNVTVEASFVEVEESAWVNPFADVKESDYFYDAVLWAAENGITSGTDATHFSPNNPCTRAQAVTFLWRSYGSPEPKSTEMPFADVAADAYYYNAVLWAVENGITTGTSATSFSPDATVTRAQTVTFLWRAIGSSVSEIVNPFEDVESSSYYADAVTWAVEQGVTSGTTATTFSPNDNCTRAQIVTFLCRYLTQ